MVSNASNSNVITFSKLASSFFFCYVAVKPVVRLDRVSISILHSESSNDKMAPADERCANYQLHIRLIYTRPSGSTGRVIYMYCTMDWLADW